MARKRAPSAAQVRALAWCLRVGNGCLRSVDVGHLEIRDATVAALQAAGWVDRVSFHDNVAKWRWHWFYITDAGRAIPAVQSELRRLIEELK